MNSRMQKMINSFLALCLLGLFVSCQDTIPRRSTITPGSTADYTPFTCDEGQEIVQEKGEDGEITQVCKDKAIIRPTNAVFWKTDFCACKDSKPVSYGNCASFCSGKATGGTEILYANFRVTEAISLGGIGNLNAWCNVNLPGDPKNPECKLEAKDEQGNVQYLSVTTSNNSNSITADIKDGLRHDKTYVLTLVERVSGARSDSVQMIKFSAEPNIPILGPLKNAPISQFTCLVRELSTDDFGDIYSANAYRLHFYFLPRVPPKPIPAGISNFICHDIFNPLFGLVDQDLYPRLEQLAGVFNLWDNSDPRFYDNNNNKLMDVNEAIVHKTRNFGGSIPAETVFFQPFKWMGSPQLEEEAGNKNSSQPLGYFMAPWIDQNTYKSYCLNASHYNSSNPLFKAMRDIIGVDTEGLYVGVKSPETIITAEGQAKKGLHDLILIRETDLKQVWFYLKNGVPTVPTDENVSNVPVFFYYPLNKASPFVQTSTQKLFRVHNADELNTTLGSGTSNTSATAGGTGTTFPPHDRKIGCVPKF